MEGNMEEKYAFLILEVNCLFKPINMHILWSKTEGTYEAFALRNYSQR